MSHFFTRNLKVCNKCGLSSVRNFKEGEVQEGCGGVFEVYTPQPFRRQFSSQSRDIQAEHRETPESIFHEMLTDEEMREDVSEMRRRQVRRYSRGGNDNEGSCYIGQDA